MCFEDLLTDACRRRAELHLIGTLCRACLSFELVEGIDTILGFRATSLRLSTHPFEFSAVEIESSLSGLLFLLVTLITLSQVVVVVPFVAVEVSAIQLDDLITNTIEEIAVVGDEE